MVAPSPRAYYNRPITPQAQKDTHPPTMDIGIIGLPQSGKTTVFNALSHGAAATGGYSAGKQSNIGVAHVEDPRLKLLTDFYKPRRTVPAEVKYVDIPGQPPETITVVAGDTGGGRAGAAIDFGGGSSLTMDGNRIDAKKISLAALADLLGGFLDRPVIDMTKAPGQFDVALQLSPEDFGALMARGAVASGIKRFPVRGRRPAR